MALAPFPFDDPKLKSWIVKAHLQYWLGAVPGDGGHFVKLIVVPVAGWDEKDQPMFTGEDHSIEYKPNYCDDWIFEGFIKWDGCSDFTFNNAHFCSPEQAADLGTLMNCCYHQAHDIINGNDHYSDFSKPLLTVPCLPFPIETEKKDTSG